MARYTLPWRRFAARGPVRRTAAGPALRARAETDAPVLRRKADLTAQVRQRLNRLYGWKGGERASPKDTTPAPETVAAAGGGRVMMGQSNPRLLTMARPPSRSRP